MNILILGGTADGRKLTALLHAQHPAFNLIYSVAGLVRKPQVPATVISGGFSQYGGMSAYCKANHVDAIVDATHPYATQIGATARATAAALQLGYWRFLRPAWQATSSDNWQHFNQRQDLLWALTNYDRVLLTLGQVSATELEQLSNVSQVWLRTAVQPNFDLPANVHWIKAIGPFDLAHEETLLADNNIQAMASKNSGGDSTSAKLQAASQIEIPVYMLDRPPAQGDEYDQFETLMSQLNHWHQQLTAQAI